MRLLSMRSSSCVVVFAVVTVIVRDKFQNVNFLPINHCNESIFRSNSPFHCS